MALEKEERLYPTYQAARNVLDGEPQAPIEFVGWTLLRSVLIMPGFAIAGARGKNLVIGALLASTTISFFALLRSYAATPPKRQLRGLKRQRQLKRRRPERRRVRA
jgi:hypothetical protein